MPSGMLLTPPKEISGRRILVGMKRRTMHRMNNGRNVQRRGRQASQETGLRAVRVHNLRLEMTDGPLQGKITRGISPGIDRAPQTGDDLNRDPSPPALFQQIAFRPQSRTGHQQNIVSE